MAVAPFKENVIVLTGASSGIGHALAHQLAEQGAWLALAARDAEHLDHVADECRNRGRRAIAIPTDVTEPTQCENLIARTINEYGRIDTLILNAGVGMWSRFDRVQDLAVFEKIMRVNYLSAVYCVFYALPHLTQTRGRIVGVSSLAGKTGVSMRTGYAATKFAMNGFLDSLRIEISQYGVTVTLTYPDYVASGGRSRNLGFDGKPVTDAPPNAPNAMTSETCARLIIRAAAKRQREAYLSTRGIIGQWAKLIVPGLVDRIALRASEKGA